jgi:hypothetical protein
MRNFVALKSRSIKSPNAGNLLNKVLSNALVQRVVDEVIGIPAKDLNNLLKGVDMKTSTILANVFKRFLVKVKNLQTLLRLLMM